MTRTRADLVQDLVRDLEPTAWWRSPWILGTAWLLGSWAFVTLVTAATGPFRPGFEDDLVREPRFLGEMLVGVLAEMSAIRATVSLGIPSPVSLLKRLALALLLLLLWVGEFVYDLFDPALAPSMLGKREGCYLQTMLFGLPPLLAALWILRRQAPLNRAWAGAAAGLAAALLPAVMMEIACMYEPVHILTHHVAPIAAVVLLGAWLGRVALRPV